MARKIAILTSGGDAPGMNAATISAIKMARLKGLEPYVIYEGYKGMYEGNIVAASDINLKRYFKMGGTAIHSARFPEFKELSIREKAKAQLDKLGIDTLIVIGGDGSYRGAQLLHELGIKVMALPGTIDNDIASTTFTIGFDTALNTIVESVEKVRNTAYSHHRCMLVEVMGRDCPDLAVYAGIAADADLVVTQANPHTEAEIAQKVKEIKEKGEQSVIVLITENQFDDLNKLGKQVEQVSGMETRVQVLGHTQRGGVPTAMERVNASRMAYKAVTWLTEGQSGLAVGIVKDKIIGTPILEALAIERKSMVRLVELVNKFGMQ